MPEPAQPLPPPDLYHYTGPAGLLGILGDGTRERGAGREIEGQRARQPHGVAEAAEGYELRPCVYDRRTQLARMANFPHGVSDEVRSESAPYEVHAGPLKEDGTRE